MRIQIIPDVHGRWMTIDKEADLIICLGDFWDSFDKEIHKQMQCFYNLLKYKKAHPDKVKLLLGNHDVQYLYLDRMNLRCSGFQWEQCHQIHDLMRENSEHFQFAHALRENGKEILFTHAGVLTTWLKVLGLEDENVDVITDVINHEPQELFWVGSTDPVPGPLWLRPHEITKDTLPAFQQYVGHSHKLMNYYDRYFMLDIGKPMTLLI